MLLINLLNCIVEDLIGERRDVVTSEFILQPGLNCGNTFTQVERRHPDHGRHISFGGNLITFSPLRPLSEEHPEEF